MAMNWREIREVTLELEGLIGASVQAIHQPEQRTLILELRKDHRNHTLLLSFAGDHSRIHLIERRPPNPRIPHSFVGMLRAHLLPGRMVSISALEGERRVTISLAGKKDEEIKSFLLECEFSGRHANVFLLDSNGIIMGSIRPNRSRKRQLIPGKAYSAMLPQPFEEPEIRFEPVGDSFPSNCGAARLFQKLAEEAIQASRLMEADRLLARKLKKLKRAVLMIERELEEALGSDDLRLRADLLQIHFHQLKQGMKSVSLQDLISGGNETLTLSLDPKRSPSENIAALYRRAGKMDRRLENLPLRIDELKEDIDHLSRLRELLQSEDIVDVDRVRGILGLDIEPERSKTQAQKKKISAPPYRRFFSAAGLEIRVGRNAKENDTVTFNLSKGDDFWFHASGYAGSHVVVPMPRGGQIDQGTLVDAANLAAHYSKARGGSVEVAYTRVRHLRKPSKRSAGQVVFSRHKSLFVDQDSQRIQRLMKSSPARD